MIPTAPAVAAAEDPIVPFVQTLFKVEALHQSQTTYATVANREELLQDHDSTAWHSPDNALRHSDSATSLHGTQQLAAYIKCDLNAAEPSNKTLTSMDSYIWHLAESPEGSPMSQLQLQQPEESTVAAIVAATAASLPVGPLNSAEPNATDGISTDGDIIYDEVACSAAGPLLASFTAASYAHRSEQYMDVPMMESHRQLMTILPLLPSMLLIPVLHRARSMRIPLPRLGRSFLAHMFATVTAVAMMTRLPHLLLQPVGRLLSLTLLAPTAGAVLQLVGGLALGVAVPKNFNVGRQFVLTAAGIEQAHQPFAMYPRNPAGLDLEALGGAFPAHRMIAYRNRVRQLLLKQVSMA